MAAGTAFQGQAGVYPITLGGYTLNLESTTTVGQFQNGVFVPSLSASLYKDYAYADGWGLLTVTIGGLSNNTQYDLRTFHWVGEATASATITLTPINGTVGGSPTYLAIFDGSVDVTTVNQFSTLMDLTSNSSGQIVFTMSASAYGLNIINGFTLTPVGIPEPSTAVSMGVGLVLMAMRLRCRVRA